MRETIGKSIEIREVDVVEAVHHEAILVMGPGWVKNGGRGA